MLYKQSIKSLITNFSLKLYKKSKNEKINKI